MGYSFIQTSNLAQFNNLIQELIQGGPRRTVFQKWEMDLLLDFGTCRMRKSSRTDILRRYQRTVQQYLLRGQYAFPGPASFLADERARRNRAKLAAVQQPEEVPLHIAV